MALCATSDQLGLSLDRQSARLSAAGGPGVSQALSSFIGELPPLSPGGTGNALTRGIVEAFGGLYYYGELEEASLMALAELVVEERMSLRITDRTLFQALEDMATLINQGWYDQARRDAIFAQMLGFGSDNDIRLQLGSVVEALTQFDQSRVYGQASQREVAAIEFSFGAMLNGMASRGGLGLERAAQVLNGQLRAALAVLGNAELHRIFRVQDMWGLVRTIAITPFGQQPDTTAIVDRAQAGAAIIGWAAGRLGEISARDGRLQATLSNDATLFRQAARWATGARALTTASSGAGSIGAVGGHQSNADRWGRGNTGGGWA